jgi:hypothetical protein
MSLLPALGGKLSHSPLLHAPLLFYHLICLLNLSELVMG